jgi:hypothetical protein
MTAAEPRDEAHGGDEQSNDAANEPYWLAERQGVNLQCAHGEKEKARSKDPESNG